MRALETSNAVNVEQWLTKMARSRPKKAQEQQAKGVWRETVPPFFSPPPSQNKQAGGGDRVASSGRDRGTEYEKERSAGNKTGGESCHVARGKVEQLTQKGLEAHRVQAESQVSSESLRVEKENQQVSTSFRTYIDENQMEGEVDNSSRMSLRGHTLSSSSINLRSGLSPRLYAEQGPEPAPLSVNGHELSQVTDNVIFQSGTPLARQNKEEEEEGEETEKTSYVGSGTGSYRSGAKSSHLKSFVPLDLSQLEVSEAGTIITNADGEQVVKGMQSVNTKVKKTEKALSKVHLRLDRAERIAREVPALEKKIQKLQVKLQESKKWKDEAVIYKRLVKSLQEKLKETEAEALHSHSVVLENMARAFESQQLDSFPVQSQMQSPLSRHTPAMSHFARQAKDAEINLDEFLSAEQQELGWGTILRECYDRIDRKVKDYDERLNLGVICGAAGLSFGLCSVLWSTANGWRYRRRK